MAYFKFFPQILFKFKYARVEFSLRMTGKQEDFG